MESICFSTTHPHKKTATPQKNDGFQITCKILLLTQIHYQLYQYLIQYFLL
jgi:hypothetical protein